MMLRKDKSSSSLKASSLSSVSSFKSFGRKLLNSSKTFDTSDIKKNAKPVPSTLKKRTTLPNELHVSSSKPKGIPITGNKTSRHPSKNESHSISRNSSITDKKMVYNPYGVMSTPSFTGNNSNNYSSSVTSINSSSNARRDASFYMYEGSQHIRVLQLPIANPNDYLPDEFRQISIHLHDNFKFENDHKNIGSGGSADVKRVISKTSKRTKTYAFKKLNMIYQETDEQYYKRCAKEFIIGKHLNSKKGYGSINIIGIYQLCKIPTSTVSVRGWGYIMELAKYDLFHVMTRIGWKNVDVNEKYCIFKQIANGIKFMHDNGIAHRDLKPENVLFCEDGVCKITDFGISSWGYTIPDDYTSGIKMCSGMIGSPPYAPPEVMRWDSKKKYPESLQKPCNPFLIDVYSLGIILMTLVNNLIPFIESCDKDSKFRDYQLSYENYIKYDNRLFRKHGSYKPGPGAEYVYAKMFKDNEASRVAWRLADPVAATRYSMEDLFEDPWFQKIEMCVDPLDEELYKFPEPELHSPLDEPSNNTENSTSRVSELKSQRSMIDIAKSPQKMTNIGTGKMPTSWLTKGLSDSAVSAPSTSPSPSMNINHNGELHISTSFSSIHSVSRSPSPAIDELGTTPLSPLPMKETNLFTVAEEDDNNVEEDAGKGKEKEEKDNDDYDDYDHNKSIIQKETGSILSNKTITDTAVSSLTTQIKQMKTESNITKTLSADPIKKRKKVIHHHLQVTNSISNMNGSSFSNSISSIASSNGSSSFRKW